MSSVSLLPSTTKLTTIEPVNQNALLTFKSLFHVNAYGLSWHSTFSTIQLDIKRNEWENERKWRKLKKRTKIIFTVSVY